MAGNEPFEIGLVKAASTAKLRQVLFFFRPRQGPSWVLPRGSASRFVCH